MRSGQWERDERLCLHLAASTLWGYGEGPESSDLAGKPMRALRVAETRDRHLH
jgi:hypothetical protein